MRILKKDKFKNFVLNNGDRQLMLGYELAHDLQAYEAIITTTGTSSLMTISPIYAETACNLLKKKMKNISIAFDSFLWRYYILIYGSVTLPRDVDLALANLALGAKKTNAQPSSEKNMIFWTITIDLSSSEETIQDDEQRLMVALAPLEHKDP